jgi:hypothetical protein
LHVSTGKAADRSEALTFQVADPRIRRDPESAAIVPKKRVRNLAIEFSISLGASGARHPHLPVDPTVQSPTRGQPDAAILVGQDGSERCVRQTLALRVRGHGQIAKPVQAVLGSDPDAPFTILEKSVDTIGCEAVRLREQIGPSMVYVNQGSVRRCDP